jgi:hypothetical protein
VKNVLHVSHARSGGIAQPERHHQVLEVAVARGKRGLLDIFLSHRNMVGRGRHVGLGELLGAAKDVDELIDARNRVIGYASLTVIALSLR